MKILTVKVIEGRLDVPEGTLHDGATVTLLVPEAEETGFRLSKPEQEKLKAAIAAADRGESVDGWQLLDKLNP